MSKDNLHDALTDLVAQVNNATSTDPWSELTNALKRYTQVKVTYGEDNTFSLPYYVKIQDGFRLISTKDWHEIVQWCHKQFGPRWDIDNIRGVWDAESNGTYHFKTEGERTMFMLRWAQ